MSNIVKARQMLLEAIELRTEAAKLMKRAAALTSRAMPMLVRASPVRRAPPVRRPVTAEKRRQVLKMVAENPTMTLHEVASRTNLGNGGRPSEIIRGKRPDPAA